MGGLTNLVYRVEMDGESYCLRVPGRGTEDYIDRKVEAHNAKVAADAASAPVVLFADPESGLMLTRYLEGFETMTPEVFARRPAPRAAPLPPFAAYTIIRPAFQFRFELFAMIDEYLRRLGAHGCAAARGLPRRGGEAGSVREALAAHPRSTLAPCHCDPLCENFLDDGSACGSSTGSTPA